MKLENRRSSRRAKGMVICSLAAAALLMLGGAMAADLNLGQATQPGLGAPAPSTGAQIQESPRMIVERAYRATQIIGSESMLTLRTIAPDESVNRMVHMYTKRYQDGTEKKYFEEMDGTYRVLIWDVPSGADQLWVKSGTEPPRTASPSESFMESAFTLQDLCVPNLDEFNFELLNTYQASRFFGMTPKTALGKRLSPKVPKMKLGIGKTDNLLGLIKYYNVAGTMEREMRAEEFELVDPAEKRYRAKKVRLTEEGRKSYLNTTYISKITPPDSTFTLEHMSQ